MERKMKTSTFTLFVLATGLLLSAQTIYVGQHVYYNGEGVVNIAADASMAVQRLDQNYVPFVLFMGTDEKGSVHIPRENVVLVYRDQEYYMPALKDFRKEYSYDNRDARQYRNFYAGIESLVATQMRYYTFNWQDEFFPSRSSGRLALDQASLTGSIGFTTFAYFKNPGLQFGDTVVIKVFDKDNPDIWGAVAVELNNPN
jgi:hypothetical protein